MTVFMPERRRIPFEEFCSLANQPLDEVAGNLGQLVADASAQGAYWHPTGFMVLNLRDFPDVGLVRLHIWPSGERRSREGHPGVHSHCFHLVSRVLYGTYFESRYRVVRAGPVDRGALWGYTVAPARGDGLDVLSLEDDRYLAEPAEERVVPAGSSHSIPTGVYHSTEVPAGSWCATLAMLSRPQPGAEDHLVGPLWHPVPARRERVESRAVAAAVTKVLGK